MMITLIWRGIYKLPSIKCSDRKAGDRKDEEMRGSESLNL